MALIKTITANGSKGHHKFTLKVSEDSTSGNSSFLSYIFSISPIQNGWDWNASGVNYSITIGSNTYTGPIYSYNGSSTTTIKSGSNIEIPHNTDGTKTINVEFSITDSTAFNFTPGNASASSTFKLTDLHKAPELSLVGVVENYSTIGIDNLFVNNLSNKTFTVNYSFYDNATPSQLNIYTRSGVKINSTATLNASQATLNVNTIRYNESDDVISNKVSFILELVDNLGGKKRITTPEYDALLYFGVNLEQTACRIKRNGQASGQATLTLKGTWFNGQVGNATNGLTIFIDYQKVGDQQTTHLSVPSNVNTGTGNNIEVNWILQENGTPITTFDKRYSYVFYVTIIDTVSRGLAGLATLTLSKGVWLMAKFKDHVDFMDATIGQNPIVESGNNANGNYIKYYDGTMICTKVVSGAEDITSAWGSMYESSAISLGDTAETFTSTPLVFATNQTSTNTGYFIENVYGSSTTSFGSTILTRPNSANNIAYSISLMAIGKWK